MFVVTSLRLLCFSPFVLTFCRVTELFCAIGSILKTVPRRLNISRFPKADCVHMAAVECGCTCGLFRLLLQCINGVFGFTCHLCVYPFCCQSVCFCACAHFNHCSLYMLKTRPSGVVIFSQLHRLRRLRDAANALSHTQKGSVWRNADRRVSTIGSFSLIAVLCTTCSEMLIKRFTCRTSQTAEH